MSSDAADRLVDFLRAEHPSKTVDSVFARVAPHAPDLTRAAVAKWFERTSGPRFSAYSALIAAYGPRLLAHVLGPGFSWLDEVALSESRKQFAGECERLRGRFGLE